MFHHPARHVPYSMQHLPGQDRWLRHPGMHLNATLAYISRRLVQTLFVLLGAYTLSFTILFVLPGDPVQIMLDGGGDGLYAEPEQVAYLREKYGLNGSLLERYLHQLVQVLSGDFGHSIQYNEPVLSLILKVLPSTLAVALLATAIALVLGTAIAVVANMVRMRWLRSALEALPALGASIPVFSVGLLLVQYFAFELRLFPPFGNDGWRSMVLPALTLSVPSAAAIAQVFSQSLSDVLAQPYCKYARAKGCSRWQVLYRYAFRNALPPVVSVLGVVVGGLLNGAVVTETVFTREGLGRLTERAVSFQDIPVVQGVVLFCAVVFAAVILLSDLVVLALDPRIGRSPEGGYA